MRGSAKVLAVLATMAALMVAAPTTQAAFPGANGKIAFSSPYEDGDVWVISPDGTGLTNLTQDHCCNGDPAWSADGGSIVFESRPVEQCPPFQFCLESMDLYKMDADGSNQTMLNGDGLFDGQGAWHPSGQQIAFTRSGDLGETGEIRAISADGSNDSPLVTVGGASARAVWSPDGTKLAFQDGSDPFDHAGFGDQSEIYVFEIGVGLTRLTDNAVFDGHPDWSPDGQKIVFTRTDTDNQIWVMNADGTGQQRIENGEESWEAYPAWSPDGTKIVYSSNFGLLRIMNPDGSNVTELPNSGAPGGDAAPDWQPLHGPQRSDYKNAAQFCKAERAFLGDSRFRQKYGGGANAHGKCVSGK